MRFVALSALIALAACSSRSADEQRLPLDRLHQDARCAEGVDFYGRGPEGGVLSSKAIAVDVAYRYLSAIYPEDRHLRPMIAKLTNGVWTVTGTLPKGYVGGVAAIEMCQSNGRVLSIAHGK